MTVRELLAALSKVDPDREVRLEMRTLTLRGLTTSKAPAEHFRLEDFEPYYIGQSPSKLLVVVAMP